MQAPKNNLQEVLRRKIDPAIISPIPNSYASSKKFKPALNLPKTGHVIPAATHTLPAFSTPGFRHGQMRSNQDELTSPDYEAVSVSSDSSPPRIAKRMSSDVSVRSEPPSQASKRFKKDTLLVEKENNFATSSTSTLSSGSKQQHVTIGRVHHARVDEEQSWFKMDLDHSRHSSAKLDREYPVFKASNAPSPVSDNNSDLLTKDLETLKGFLFNNYELAGDITKKELEHHRGILNNTDITLLQRLSAIVNERVESIKKLIALRGSDIQVHESIPASLNSKDISASQGLTHSGLDSHIYVDSISRLEELPAIDVNDDIEPADYWASAEDVPLEASFSDEPISMTSVSVCDELASSPYYPEVFDKLKTIFGLEKFRHNQLAAVTEALRGRDVFVLMPTGGGKSLCYQLPAVCQNGKTKGVTVVVSPLLSLMKDQVHSLERRKVNVFLWNSEVPYEQAMARMRAKVKPNIVYITPEKLKENNAAQRILGELYRENELARFVIDEAHCISTWGQDFREAYQHLGNLRLQFPNVPIMALTATARKITVDDIKSRLKLNNCAFFTQSFNRPNLRYVIKQKTRRWMESMMEFISTNHPKKSGVIYCLGREKCEEVARKLDEHGFSAKHFHAGLTQAEKDRTLDEWRQDKVQIIVATIAFGMGIDKADVRFVIHYSLPKSLDGYYQETGRAGRDGKPADCVLYYLYKDFITVKGMIERPDINNIPPTRESIERQTAAARAVVDYCTNLSECRRVQVLHYFDEKFDKSNCHGGCDNCENPVPLSTRDVTKEAGNIIELVKSFQDRSTLVTLAQCRDILRGANTATVRSRSFDKEPLFGSARDLSTDLVDLTFRKLCQMDILVEQSIQQLSGYHSEYIKLGPSAQELRRHLPQIMIHWRPKPGKIPRKALSRTAANKPSTSKNRAKGKEILVEADSIELFEEDSPSVDSDSDVALVGPNKAGSSFRTEPEQQTSFLEAKASNDLMAAKLSHDSDSPSQLYQRMRELRTKVMSEKKISDPEDIFSDITLQLLSATCPEDYKAFQSCIREEMSKEEAEAKYKQHGAEFLNMCFMHKLSHNNMSTSSHETSNMLRSRFAFQNPASLSGVRKSKFKPH